MPLAMAPKGKKLILKEIIGGNNVRKRLTEMGLIPGAKFSIVSRNCSGPILIDILKTRIALGRGLAMKVMVEEG